METLRADTQLGVSRLGESVTAKLGGRGVRFEVHNIAGGENQLGAGAYRLSLCGAEPPQRQSSRITSRAASGAEAPAVPGAKGAVPRATTAAVSGTKATTISRAKAATISGTKTASVSGAPAAATGSSRRPVAQPTASSCAGAAEESFGERSTIPPASAGATAGFAATLAAL
jgi:hypothetical protein